MVKLYPNGNSTFTRIFSHIYDLAEDYGLTKRGRLRPRDGKCEGEKDGCNNVIGCLYWGGLSVYLSIAKLHFFVGNIQAFIALLWGNNRGGIALSWGNNRSSFAFLWGNNRRRFALLWGNNVGGIAVQIVRW